MSTVTSPQQGNSTSVAKLTFEDAKAFYHNVFSLVAPIMRVDNTGSNHIRGTKSGDIYLAKCDDELKPLALLTSTDKNALIVNPLAEGAVSETIGNSAFYRNFNLFLSGTVNTLLAKTIFMCDAAKHEGASEETVIDAANKKLPKSAKKSVKEDKDEDILRNNLAKNEKITSKEVMLVAELFKGDLMSMIDDKTISNVKTLVNNLDIISIYYVKRENKSVVNCKFFSEEFQKSYKSIKPNTWKLLQQLTLRLFKVDDISELSYVPKSNNVRKFESYLALYLRLFRCLAPYSSLINDPIDICVVKELESCIPHLDEYSRLVSWSVSSYGSTTPANELPSGGLTPVGGGVSTSAIPNLSPVGSDVTNLPAQQPIMPQLTSVSGMSPVAPVAQQPLQGLQPIMPQQGLQPVTQQQGLQPIMQQQPLQGLQPVVQQQQMPMAYTSMNMPQQTGYYQPMGVVQQMSVMQSQQMMPMQTNSAMPITVEGLDVHANNPFVKR